MSQAPLDSLQFEPMLISALFRPHKGKRVIAADRDAGDTPFVAGSELNNSITDFSDLVPLFPGGWLTLTYNGSIGQTRLQPVPFFASDDVIALEPINTDMSPVVKLVLAAIIQHECVGKFSYANKLNLKRLSKQQVMVPIVRSPSGQVTPDWDGMEALGRELRQKTLQARDVVLQADVFAASDLPDLHFTPMLLTDVFNRVRASTAWYDRINLRKSGERMYPFVSRSAASNGVVEFVPHQAKQPEAGNVITLGLDTQTLGYQPVSFYTSQNIQILEHDKLNVYNALVLMAAIRQQLGKFSWGGNGATLKRLKATHIMVPVTSNGLGQTVLDWDGMTAYGQAMRARVEGTVYGSDARNSEDALHA